MFRTECVTYGNASSQQACRSEFEANNAGFSCVAIERKAMPKAHKGGVNTINLAGYGITLLALLAVVF